MLSFTRIKVSLHSNRTLTKVPPQIMFILGYDKMEVVQTKGRVCSGMLNCTDFGPSCQAYLSFDIETQCCHI